MDFSPVRSDTLRTVSRRWPILTELPQLHWADGPPTVRACLPSPCVRHPSTEPVRRKLTVRHWKRSQTAASEAALEFPHTSERKSPEPFPESPPIGLHPFLDEFPVFSVQPIGMRYRDGQRNKATGLRCSCVLSAGHRD